MFRDNRQFLRVRNGDKELVVLARDNETIVDLARELSLDYGALFGLNRDYIQSIRLWSKLRQGTFVRVPDIPRFSSRAKLQLNPWQERQRQEKRKKESQRQWEREWKQPQEEAKALSTFECTRCRQGMWTGPGHSCRRSSSGSSSMARRRQRQ